MLNTYFPCLSSLALSLAVLMTVKPAAGATWTVLPDGSGDAPTIQAAVDSAVAGDVVELADGVFLGIGNRDIDFAGKAISIRSQSGNPDACEINCQFAGRGFYFHSGEDSLSTVQDLTVRYGYRPTEQGGGMLFEESSPTIMNCTIRDCVADNGGAISVSGAHPKLLDCHTENNRSFSNGGAIYSSGNSAPEILRCEIIGNVADTYGGGLYVTNSTMNILQTRIEDNNARRGGALYTTGSDLTLDQCVVSWNVATQGGGGVWSYGPTLNLLSCTFEHNETTTSSGGGLYFDGPGSLELADVALRFNSAVVGGALFAFDSSIDATRLVVEQNSASSSAGGFALEFSTGSVTNSDFIGNQSGDYGGAVGAWNNGHIQWNHCTFFNGSAEYNGSAIDCRNTDFTMENCSFVRNTTLSGLGVVASRESSNIELRGCIIGFSDQGRAVDGFAALSCCDVFGNADGDWTGSIASQFGIGGNISLDPLFCDIDANDLHLGEGSPCAPFTPPNEPCDLIGAWPVGCGPTCPIEVTSTTGGETVCESDLLAITWDYADSCASSVSIDLLLHGVPCLTIAESTANDGTFEWTAEACSTGVDYSIRVSDPSGWPYDDSEGTFAIGEISPPSVSSPAGGESFAVSEEVPIVWDAGPCNGPNVLLELLRNGAPCDTISASTENDGLFLWPAAQCGLETDAYAVRVTDVEAGLAETSNGNFQIIPSCALTVVSPNGGEELVVGDPVEIQWTSVDSCGAFVGIELLQDGSECLVLSASTENDGSFTWVAEQCGDTNGYTVRVTDLNTGTSDTSNAPFTINPTYRIESIADVGNDQGRQVRLTWQSYWTDGGGDPATLAYEIYRRQDEFLQSPKGPGTSPEGSQGAFLEGWDFIESIPAHGDSIYQYVAPTLCDSTAGAGICWSVYFVRAATDHPLVYFDTPPDSGYSVDNLAPMAPENLRWDNDLTDLLLWDESQDLDFDYFSVYGAAQPEMGEATLLAQTTEPLLDVSGDPFGYYLVTAIDFAGNEGLPGTIESDGPRTYIVSPDGSGQFPTIQAAIDAASPADTVSLVDGVYSGDGNRDLDFAGKGVVLRSAGDDPTTCIINCGGSGTTAHRGISFASGEGPATVVQGVTITGGAAFGGGLDRFGGAIYCSGSSPTIRGCILEGNVAERNGGAINLFQSSIRIEDCIIRGNEAPLGAGINSSSSSPEIVRTQITGNLATEGGGGARFHGQYGSSPTISSTTISGNQSILGGGVLCASACSLEVSNTIVWGNCATDGTEIRLDSAESMVTVQCSDFDLDRVSVEPGATFDDGSGDNIALPPFFCEALDCLDAPSVLGDFTLDAASPCLDGASPAGCGLIGAYGQGCDVVSGAPDVLATPTRLSLSCGPNPFTDRITLRLAAPQGPLEVAVFDASGKRIRTLVSTERRAGSVFSIDWDGTNDGGTRTASGVYFCRATAGSETRTVRMVAIRR